MSMYKVYLRKTLKLTGWYVSGVILSTSFVLVINDLFYNTLFKGKDIHTIWRELRPREVFGTGAKKTFIKHKIENEQSTQDLYMDYLEKRRNGGEDVYNTEAEKLSKDIFSNKKI